MIWFSLHDQQPEQMGHDITPGSSTVKLFLGDYFLTLFPVILSSQSEFITENDSLV